MQRFHLLRAAYLAVALAAAPALLTTGCAQLSGPVAEQQVTPRETVATADKAVETAVTAASASRDAGFIVKGSSTETEIDKGIDSANSALDAAHAALRTNANAPAWKQWLDIATTATNQLFSRLAQIKGAK